MDSKNQVKRRFGSNGTETYAKAEILAEQEFYCNLSESFMAQRTHSPILQ
jgi:hypothetical protein